MAFVNIEAAFLTVVQRFLRRKRKTDLPRSRVSFIFIPVLMNFMYRSVSYKCELIDLLQLVFQAFAVIRTSYSSNGCVCDGLRVPSHQPSYEFADFFGERMRCLFVHLFLNLLVSSSPLLIKVGTQAFDLHEMGIEKKR
jgi:hypothetical protein